ncbi:MAG: cytochrome c biogenesis protein CcsA [Proteobacteria bacterium]|nr:cytochrome c biogenesis protein CcsA [Pseudomonadota bacterium]
MPAGYIFGVVGLFIFALTALAATLRPGGVRANWEHGIGLYALGLLVYGQYGGLYLAPPDTWMADVARILYVHVPAAWISMVAFTWAFAAAFGALMLERPKSLPVLSAATAVPGIGLIGLAMALTGVQRGLAAFFGILLILTAVECALLWIGNRFFNWTSDTLDHISEASTEVGVVLGVLLLFLGSVFSRPTFNVYWTWDPRLTASAVMVLTFVGVSLLRSSVDDPITRRTWSNVATILAYINIPVTYMSVKWWRTIHQLQSTPDTLSSDMTFWLRLNAWAFLFLSIWFVARRWRIARARALAEAPPELPPAPEIP